MPLSGIWRAVTGSEQVAVEGLTPEAEPAPRDLARVVAAVRDERRDDGLHRAARSPRSPDGRTRDRHAVRARPARGPDAREVDRGADYFTVMRANLAALEQGLGCR